MRKCPIFFSLLRRPHHAWCLPLARRASRRAGGRCRARQAPPLSRARRRGSRKRRHLCAPRGAPERLPKRAWRQRRRAPRRRRQREASRSAASRRGLAALSRLGGSREGPLARASSVASPCSQAAQRAPQQASRDKKWRGGACCSLAPWRRGRAASPGSARLAPQQPAKASLLALRQGRAAST